MISKIKSNHFFYNILLLFVLTSCFTDIDEIKTESEHIKTVLHLTTSSSNPRNSEGSFIQLKSGRIMFVYSHFTESSNVGDSTPAHLASRFSDDEGLTWSKDDKIIVGNEGVQNVMSVSLLRLHNDNIALFYLRKNSQNDCIPILRISNDEGETWSEPITCILDRKGYFVLNNDRIIQLKNGRILMPVSLHSTPDGRKTEGGAIYCYYSDDNGLTWSSNSKVPNKDQIIIQEPGVIEMKNGVIMMFMRSMVGFQQLSFSHDKGETWSDIESSNIVSPLSPASIKKIPKTNNWLLIWNHTKGSNNDPYGNRSPLSAAISKDEGLTWTNIRNIADNPYASYSYTAIHFIDDNNILVSFLYGLQTVVVRINKKFFY